MDIVATMAYVLRRMVVLVAALALIATSVGWSVSGATTALKVSHESGMASASLPETSHHHGDRASKQAGSCSDAEDCGDHAGLADLAESCCGSACHLATPAGACRQILVPMNLLLEAPAPEDDIQEASLARLERPPRSIAG